MRKSPRRKKKPRAEPRFIHKKGPGAIRGLFLLRDQALSPASFTPSAAKEAAKARRSQAMARGVAQALDAILGTVGLSVQQLKAHGRYAEDTF